MGPCESRIEPLADDGTMTVLKVQLPLRTCDVWDGAFMVCALLCGFQEALASGVLFSLHL